MRSRRSPKRSVPPPGVVSDWPELVIEDVGHGRTRLAPAAYLRRPSVERNCAPRCPHSLPRKDPVKHGCKNGRLPREFH